MVPSCAASAEALVASRTCALPIFRRERIDDPNARAARWSKRGKADTKRVMTNLQAGRELLCADATFALRARQAGMDRFHAARACGPPLRRRVRAARASGAGRKSVG